MIQVQLTLVEDNQPPNAKEQEHHENKLSFHVATMLEAKAAIDEFVAKLVNGESAPLAIENVVGQTVGMLHQSENLYFGRLPDGKVRILKLANAPVPPEKFPEVDGVFSNALFDVTIDDGHWGSVVAAVSAKGEAGGRWYKAMDFHHGRT